MSAFRDILRELVLARVRFVVVGGVAVVLHGFLRGTKDLDIVVDLSPEEARKAIVALQRCGLHPTVPVNPMDFADESIRHEWMSQKNMLVFQMRDPQDARRNIDIFVEYPAPFEELWERSVLLPIDDVTVRVASIPHLIAMKRKAGRTQDVDDIEQLEKLERLNGKRDPR